MTVHELIELLYACNADSTVLIAGTEDNPLDGSDVEDVLRIRTIGAEARELTVVRI